MQIITKYQKKKKKQLKAIVLISIKMLNIAKRRLIVSKQLRSISSKCQLKSNSSGRVAKTKSGIKSMLIEVLQMKAKISKKLAKANSLKTAKIYKQ